MHFARLFVFLHENNKDNMKRILFSYLLFIATLFVANAQEYVCNTEKINVAVIMPFDLDHNVKSTESKKALDFYEGILMTVDSLKKAGVNIYVQALDEGSATASKIQSVVQHPFLKEADVIIGPGRGADIAPLTTFAQSYHIPLVVPFANTLNLANGKPYVFQCNTQHFTHYEKVFKRFVKHHSTENVFFVDMKDRNQKEAFTAGFTKHLQENAVPYKYIEFSDFDDKLTEMLDSTRNNILVPSSASAHFFDMLCMKLDDMKLLDKYQLQLIGTPEWQTFPKKSQSAMYKYKATFFTSFYNNNLSSRTRNFMERFTNNFHHEQYGSYPRYGEMGHDISAFFLTAIQRYGNKFFTRIQQHDYNSLQLPMHFVRTAEGNGFTNQATYIIYYRNTGDVILSTF